MKLFAAAATSSAASSVDGHWDVGSRESTKGEGERGKSSCTAADVADAAAVRGCFLWAHSKIVEEKVGETHKFAEVLR